MYIFVNHDFIDRGVYFPILPQFLTVCIVKLDDILCYDILS